jgi:methylase of polypeptide subunit release factors
VTGARAATHDTDSGGREVIEFHGLSVAFDSRVLRPRPWTAKQSQWAAQLLTNLPDGPVLELCSGAGQIGLAAVADSQRRLVCVDADPVAASYARENARAAGMDHRVEIRQGLLSEALSTDEAFALVIADPPWVRRAHTGRYPADPLLAIDGGHDGLDVARECIEVAAGHLLAGGAMLLQLGDAGQVRALTSQIDGASMRLAATRAFEGGIVARLTLRDERRASTDQRTDR